MRRLLDRTITAPAQLFADLTVSQIAQGFQDVGRHEDEAFAVAEILAPLIRDIVRQGPIAPVPEMSPRLTDDEIKYGDFRVARVPPIERLLRITAARYGDADGLRHVVNASLRYATVYARTRQIGPPQAVFDRFYEWGVRNEAFASPFNARLLGRPDVGFFSVFPDTDGPLGSYGSFFSADHARFPGAWAIDPPFLSETIHQAEAIITRMRSWTDAPAILLIVPTAHALSIAPDEAVQMTPGIHHYEGLDGQLRPLPIGVSIYRFGELKGFNPREILAGYLPEARAVAK